MRTEGSHLVPFSIGTAALVFVASLTLTGQEGAPVAPAQTPTVQAPAAPNGQQGQAAQPAQPGRGGRGGLGGPQRDDPANAGVDFGLKDPALPLRPGEQLSHFILPPGYKMELVLADPVIQEPTAIAFDGNGRMFVLEDRGYMRDADATGELEPVGRISMHEDRDNDGRYERSTVFVDNLVFPRFVTPFGPNAVLTMESDADEVWKFTDTDNDGIADRKELFETGFGRAGNVEHQQAFLFQGMDNWLYSSVNAFRIRATANGMVREATGANNAQWGLAQDNDGKIWFQGGASGVPSYFQFPIHYGNFTVPDQLEPDFQLAWGAPVRVADMQGGMPAVRMPDGSLNRVTGAAGNDVFRGDRLPADLSGDLLYGEPVGRLVRRARPVVTEGLTQLRNVYRANEFIKSTDPFFRPVDMATAPDGTLYIVDMYHGIIQEANWARPGTYLRARIEQYGLDKVVGLGRIWRVTYDGMSRDTRQPQMFNETAAQLVQHLSHPNGWWRDTAQQLLVHKQDRSIAPALQQMVRAGRSLEGRFHALWTLEGIGSLDATLVQQMMRDSEPRMRIQAMRAAESLYKAGNRSLGGDIRGLIHDPDVDVVLQAMLSLHGLRVPERESAIQGVMASNQAAGVQLIGKQMLAPNANAFGRGGRGGPAAFSAAEAVVMETGERAYTGVCANCHGLDGRGMSSGDSELMAPSLISSRVTGHPDYAIKTVLHGLTGPIEDRSYADGLMVAMGRQTDEWVASVLSYIRNSFGSASPFITSADVARVRAANTLRTSPWTYGELTASLPRALTPEGTWRATASHNAATAADGLTFQEWNSGTPQAAGMWFQVELPEVIRISELQFDSLGQGGGRGAGNAPPVIQFPRGYSVQVSVDGTTWSAPVAQGPGSGATTVIRFEPAQAKFVRITQTAQVENAPNWSIQRLRVYAAAAATTR